MAISKQLGKARTQSYFPFPCRKYGNCDQYIFSGQLVFVQGIHWALSLLNCFWLYSRKPISISIGISCLIITYFCMETNYQRNNEKRQRALNIAWQKGVRDVPILVTPVSPQRFLTEKKIVSLRLRVATDIAQLLEHRTEREVE